MAEFVMKDLVKKAGRETEFLIESAATSTEEIGNPVHRGTKQKLAQFNISVAGKTARQMTKKDYEEFDYIIAMDSFNTRNITRIVDDKYGKVSKLLNYAGESGDIADPWYTGNFDETYEDVLRGCKGLLKYLDK